MKLMKHYANSSLIISHLISQFGRVYSQGVSQTLPDLLFFTGQAQSKRVVDVMAGVAIFQ